MHMLIWTAVLIAAPLQESSPDDAPAVRAEIREAWPGHAQVTMLAAVTVTRWDERKSNFCSVRSHGYVLVVSKSKAGGYALTAVYGPLWDRTHEPRITSSDALSLAAGSAPEFAWWPYGLTRYRRAADGVVVCESLPLHSPQDGWRIESKITAEFGQQLAGWPRWRNPLELLYQRNPGTTEILDWGTLVRFQDPWLADILGSIGVLKGIDNVLITHDRKYVFLCPNSIREHSAEDVLVIGGKPVRRRGEVAVYERPQDSPRVLQWPLRTLVGAARILSCKAGLGLLAYEDWDGQAQEKLDEEDRGLVLAFPFSPGLRYFFPLSREDDFGSMIPHHDEAQRTVRFCGFRTRGDDWRGGSVRLFSWHYDRSRVTIVDVPMTDLFRAQGRELVPVVEPKQLRENQ